MSNVTFQNLDKFWEKYNVEPKPDYFKPLTELKNIGDLEYQNYIIVTDEFRGIIDSRMSGSFKNRFISNILRDTGKDKQIHILTDQDGNAIDRRVRNNTNIVLRPLLNLKTGKCVVKIFDNYDQYYYVRGFDAFDDWDIEFSFEAKDYWGYYNTEQKIEDYFITFKPEENFDKLRVWMMEENIMKHSDFTITKGLLTYWQETTGEYLSDTQKSALMEYIKYKTELPIFGRKTKGKD